MEQYIFTSDPHGRGEPWIDLVKQAQNKYPNAQVIFGGDYIDGRKDSKANLDFVMDEVKSHNAIALLGNHEQLMMDFLEGKDDDYGLNNSLWIMNGGKTTIRSIIRPLFHTGFSLQKSAEVIKYRTPYYEFLTTLPVIHETENIIFVHAGVNPVAKNYSSDNAYKNNKDKIQYYLWAREDYFWQQPNSFLSPDNIFNHNLTGKTIVTGHTPTCLLYGKYENDIKPPLKKLPFTQCPVRVVQYPNEPARIFTDNGCHSKMAQHKGNIVILDTKGNVLDMFN